MADLLYRGVGVRGSNICKFLYDRFGLRASLIGSNIVISEKDASNAFPIRGIVKQHEQLELTPGKELEIARQMASRISVAQPKLGSVEIKVLPEFGLLGEVAKA